MIAHYGVARGAAGAPHFIEELGDPAAECPDPSGRQQIVRFLG